MRSCSQQEYLSDSSQGIKETCTRTHSWRLLLTQNQANTLKFKEKLEALEFSCLFSRKRKHLGLGSCGRKETEELAFAAIRENISECTSKKGKWGFCPPTNCSLFRSSIPWAAGEDEANAFPAWTQDMRLQLTWHLGMRHNLFTGQGRVGLAALHPSWKHKLVDFAKLKTVSISLYQLIFLVQLLFCLR